MSRVLVTGGAGFIGSHIVDLLIAEGHTVVVVDDLSGGDKKNLNPKAKFYQIDICDPQLKKIFVKEKIEWINHHAAQIDVRKSVQNPAEDLRVNLVGLLNLLGNARDYKCKGIIFASSGAIYDERAKLPVCETAEKTPLSPYGVSKLSSEHYLHSFFRITGIPYVALRYANVYGPRQDALGEAGVVAAFVAQMLSRKVPTIFGDGDQTRDYVFVGDVTKANLAAMRYLATGRNANSVDDLAFNVSTGIETSVHELYEKLQQITEFEETPQDGSERPGEIYRSALSPAKAAKELGWRPDCTLQEGLKRTIESMKGDDESA